MRKLIGVLVITLLAAPVSAAEDVSGKWSGKFTFVAEGEKQQTEVFAVLTQKGAELTGTIGPEERIQWPISRGKTEVTKEAQVVVFSADYARRDMSFSSTYELRLVNGHLVGKMKLVSDGKTTEADMDMQRVK